MDRVPWSGIPVPVILFVLYLAIGFVVPCLVTVRELFRLTHVPAHRWLFGGLIYLVGALVMLVIMVLALRAELPYPDLRGLVLPLICGVPPLIGGLLAMYAGRRRYDAMRKDR